VDLSGADGWTVAAHCARLGDKTMLDDYNAGIKPAKVIALLHTIGPQVNTWSRDRIIAEGKHIGKGDTEALYFTCKRVQHGTNYLLGVRTMANLLLKDGYKYLGQMIIVSENSCRELQKLYLSRYPGVKAWQDWIAQELYNKGTLPCASGHVRRFFGRRNDNNTQREACAHEPQANTTYATNLGILNLWNDPENRHNGQIIIKPIHQVHDAILGIFPRERSDWAVAKIKSYLSNELSIAGQSITIPFEGAYGPTWGDCDDNTGTPVGYI
jgi:hypothetical protein